MELTAHPEQARYRQHQAHWPFCRTAIERWRVDGSTIPVAAYDLAWTYTGAQMFVHQLAALFQAYNQVLWEHFPYCSACGGQCCVVDASDVRTFDLLALALLGETPPVLPAWLDAGRRTCIYLTSGSEPPRCSWPERWRTVKCWSFYCLGSKPLAKGADVGESYRTLTAALASIVEERLPQPLRRYEGVANEQLSARLEDPVDFSNTIHRALAAIFVDPFMQCYPIASLAVEPPEATPNLFLLEDEVTDFIVAAMVELDDDRAGSTGDLLAKQQLWEDLSTLSWIVENRPATARRQLHELEQRHAQAQDFDLGHRLHSQLLHLLAVWQ